MEKLLWERRKARCGIFHQQSKVRRGEAVQGQVRGRRAVQGYLEAGGLYKGKLEEGAVQE
jgi:hypothetical protein